MTAKEILTYFQWVYWYLYNEDVETILDLVYPGAVPHYLESKKEKFYHSRMDWFFDQLDNENKELIVNAAIKKYNKNKDKEG